MTFRYFVTFDRDNPNEPLTLFAINDDEEAGRFDTILFNQLTKTWESDPSAVGMFFHSPDYYDERKEISRSRAEEIAPIIGTTLPSEEEMMRISDDAERAAERRRRRRR